MKATMNVPYGAVYEAALALGPHADQNRDHSAGEAALEASLEWLVENDPGFLLRLVFSVEELKALHIATPWTPGEVYDSATGKVWAALAQVDVERRSR